MKHALVKMSRIAHARHGRPEERHLDWRIVVGLGFIIACFFQAAFMYSDPVAPFMRFLTRLSVLACLGIYFWKVHIDLIGGLALAYMASMFVSTVLNGGALDDCLLNYGPPSASVMLARVVIPMYRRELLWALLVVLGFYTIANLIVLCIVPIGVPVLHANYSTTFLSYRNGFCRYYFPAITASLLLDLEAKRLISPRTVLFAVAGFAQSLIAYSATSVFAFVVFALIVAFGLILPKARQVLNAITFGGIYVVAFLLIVVFRLQNLLSPLIGAMGRSVTFTGRTYVWDSALALIDGDHFLFGHFGTPGKLFVLPSGGRVGTAHNALLDAMVWGGVVAVCLFIALIAVASINLYRHRQERAAGVLSAYIGVFLLMGLMESITCSAFFLFLGIACTWSRAQDQRSFGEFDDEPLQRKRGPRRR